MTKEEILKEIERTKRLIRLRFYGLVLLSCVLLTSIIYVSAYYISSRRVGNDITSSEFYFSVIAEGDPDDVLSSDPLMQMNINHLSYTLVNEATIDLYSHSSVRPYDEKIYIKNYLDDLRVTDADINYTVNFEVVDKAGKAIDMNSGISPAILTYKYEENGVLPLNNSSSLSNKVLTPKTSSKSTKLDTDTLTISIPSKGKATNIENYDGIKIVVDIKSTSPYTKEYKVNYILHDYIPKEKYYMVNRDDHYELIITTDTGYDPKKLQIYYPDTLVIDKSDPYLISDESRVQTLTTNPYSDSNKGHSIVINKAIAKNATCSIKFFKADSNSDTINFMPISLKEIGEVGSLPTQNDEIKVVKLS